MGLVGGVVALDLVFLAVGYALLAAPLAGAPPLRRASWAGVALLVGAGAVGVVMCVVAVAGAPTGLVALGVVSGVLVTAGLVTARVRPGAGAPRPAAPAPVASSLETVLAIVAGFVAAAVCAMAIVGGFRSSPWLDDAWGFWLPRGLFLTHEGLDARAFGPAGTYVPFTHADYPLLWSIVPALGQRFVGDIDLRAMNAQLALLLVAFVGAVARLLHGRVRPSALACGLLVLVVSPELFRQAQGGGADLVLAAYLALAVLGGGLWVLEGDRLGLGIAAVAAAAALQTKNEALPELVVLLVLGSLLGWRRGARRIGALFAALVFGLALLAPWVAWRLAHDLRPTDYHWSKVVDPGYLAAHTDRLAPAARALADHLTSPREWIVLPVLLALLAVGLAVERRALWLAPLVPLAALFALLVWIYWASSADEGYVEGYVVSTSAYRTIDTLVLVAAVLVPVLAERLAEVAPRRVTALRRARAS